MPRPNTQGHHQRSPLGVTNPSEGKVESGLLEAVADELRRHPGITFIPIQRAMIERGSDEPLRVEPRLLPNGLADLIFTRLEVTPTADVRELVEAAKGIKFVTEKGRLLATVESFNRLQAALAFFNGEQR